MAPSDGAASAGAPRTRLIITHMTLENFKSYAGVQQIGPFHKVSARRVPAAAPRLRETPRSLSCRGAYCSTRALAFGSCCCLTRADAMHGGAGGRFAVGRARARGARARGA